MGNELTEAHDVVAAGGAHVEPGCDACARCNRVCANAPVGDAVIDVRMHIYQPRRNIFTGCIQHAMGRLDRYIAVDCRDAIARDSHIELSGKYWRPGPLLRRL